MRVNPVPQKNVSQFCVGSQKNSSSVVVVVVELYIVISSEGTLNYKLRRHHFIF